MSAWMRLLVLGALLACGTAQAAESPPIHPAIQAAVDSQERRRRIARATRTGTTPRSWSSSACGRG